MCGIFGYILSRPNGFSYLKKLAAFSQSRGKDSSGLVYFSGCEYKVYRANYQIKRLVSEIKPYKSQVLFGHSRLITNGLSDNQPVVRDNLCLVHNGIIVNNEELWKSISLQRKFEIDSEVILAIAKEHLLQGGTLSELAPKILAIGKGVMSCALLIPDLGKLLLFSNNGSLYLGRNRAGIFFASEKYTLLQIGCSGIEQIKECILIDIPVSKRDISVHNDPRERKNLIPSLTFNQAEERLLEFQLPISLKRCSRCILPETMPFIAFNTDGVCNYCLNYKLRNNPKPKEELYQLIDSYRRVQGNDCIVPFSGGRDSCYALHLIVNELKMKPVAYTYDWGMITDLGRRNISRMCAELGTENILIAADISRKRKNIAMNLKAWLKSPHLGMMCMLTAGDKHFFRHIETVKKKIGVSLNLWGINPLEVTHFKTGYLGIKPDFEERRVYTQGLYKQVNYHFHRAKAMLHSLGYFNSSLWDTLSGEYYRSVTKKQDYFHIFDYWRWDEKIINDTLYMYNWERAVDTNATWRIGDGTAAFYNYVYYTVAGFTEHDTFRSNQIREGDISRELALELVSEENRPRYPNIRWYLDVLGMDFKEVISVVNAIPKIYPI